MKYNICIDMILLPFTVQFGQCMENENAHICNYNNNNIPKEWTSRTHKMIKHNETK